MKKLLVITNAYPSEEKKYAGVFVKNQVEWLRQNTALDVSVYYLEREFTSFFGSIIKYCSSIFNFSHHLVKEYHVVHVHFLSPLIILAFLYKLLHPSCHTVITMHGSDINFLNNKALIYIYRYLSTRIDTIICVEESMRDKVKKKLKKNVDYIICAGINTENIQNNNLAYPKRDIDYLFVGSFYHVKGIDRIIDALTKINTNNSNFVFIGSGRYLEELQKLQIKKDLKIIGGVNQNELNEYYNRSKFLICPSRSEGFCMVLAESMYCGTPAIVSDIEQFKHLVRNKWNGFICENTNVANLARLMEETQNLSVKEWNRLSSNASKTMSPFTLEKVGRALEKIYFL